MININELSAILGVHTNTIRHWENLLGVKTLRNNRGNREYNEKSLELLKRIKLEVDKTKNLELVKSALNEEIVSHNNLIVSLQRENEPFIEVIQNDNYYNKQDFDSVLNPVVTQLADAKKEVKVLRDENLILTRENATLLERCKNYNDILNLKDNLILEKEICVNELKERIKLLEAAKTRNWWKFWG